MNTGPPVERPDLRLVPPAVAAWLTALATLGTTAGRALGVAAVGGLLGTALVLLSRRNGARWLSAAAAVSVSVAAAAVAVGLRLAAVASGPLPELADGRAVVVVEAVITGDPEVHSAPSSRVVADPRPLVIVPARADVVVAGGHEVDVRSPVVLLGHEHAWTKLLPSHRVRVTGRAVPPRFGELVSAQISARAPPRVLESPSALHRGAGAVRAALRTAVQPLPPAQRGVLPGLVVGDTSLLPPGLRKDFEKSGLTHLMAVSGSNVAIVMAAVLALARGTGLGARAAPVAAGLGVLGFAMLARPSPSVLRATLMGLITLIALATGRERRALPALAGTVLTLVLVSPSLARSYGFALSVLATTALIILAPGWTERLARFMPRWLAASFAIPAAAQVACAPIIVLLSARVSLVAVPANLLAAPAVAPATVLGLCAAVSALVMMPVAHVIARVAGVAVGWIVGVARTMAALPYGAVPWPAGLAGAALLVVVVLGGALVLRLRRLRRVAAVATIAAVLAAAAVRCLPSGSTGWPPPGWILVMCDVGQGDALVLNAGTGTTVMVDTGPAPGRADQCLRELGADRIALLVLTHSHADHVGGLPGVVRRRQVGAALIGRRGQWPAESGTRQVRRWLRRADVPVRHAARGQRWRVGRLRLTVLGPRGGPAIAADGESGANNRSIVLRATWSRGVTALLTGDIEEEAQRTLLTAGGLRADILKVPHHGSPQQVPAFFAAVGARIALTSVGEGNDYGHPAVSTLRALRSAGARSYRTDRDGDIAVVSDHGELSIVGRQGHGGAPLSAGRGPHLPAVPATARRIGAPARAAPGRRSWHAAGRG